MANPDDAFTEEKRVYEGNLTDLPSEEKNVVNVFLSSTFTDYAVERNAVMNDVTPKLKKYCRSKGLDFQISDMRWGVRDDIQDDHNTSMVVLHELHRCKRQSRGPYFLGLLGNRYGSRPYPNEIETEEFNILLKAGRTEARDMSLIEEWFLLDENAVPPVFVLQPITSKYPYYYDMCDENKEKREEDVKEWDAVNELIVNTFRACATLAHSNGQLTKEQKDKYYISVTENEFAHGVINDDKVNSKTLVFLRNFEDVNVSDEKAWRFIDLDAGQVDEEVKDLLDTLKYKKIKNALTSDNIHSDSLTWEPVGIDENNEVHKAYIERFKEKVYNELVRLTDEAIVNQAKIIKNKNLYEECLHQVTFCCEKSAMFCGRADLIAEIKEKILKLHELEQDQKEKIKEKIEEMKDKIEESDAENEKDQAENPEEQIKQTMQHFGVEGSVEMADEIQDSVKDNLEMISLTSSYTKPLIITGPSGSGKTALMAQLIKCFDTGDFLKQRPNIIARFLGTSKHSTSIKAVLESIIQQICVLYNIPSPPIELQNDYISLVLYFHVILRKIDTSEKALVIFLDSVDQLQNSDQCYSLNWLPAMLPQNVYFVISTLPDLFCILENGKRLCGEERVIEIPIMSTDTANSIMDKWGAFKGRTFTKEQKEIITSSFKRCPTPLFLKLLFQQAIQWRSYTPLELCTLGVTVRGAIKHFFDDLEKLHGEVLVSNGLAYLTASKFGLTDTEIEDLLSLDDEVLQDTYLYHLPTNDKVISLAPLLWRRVRYSIQEYLVARKVDDTSASTWYHRQFIEAATERYLEPQERREEIHRRCAEYFDGKWNGGVVKPLELYKKKKATYTECTRGVQDQPLMFSDHHPNLRRLSQLPHHLASCNQPHEFVEKICRNFHFLYYKMKFSSYTAVIEDLVTAIDTFTEDPEAESAVTEIQSLLDTLNLSHDSLNKDPNNLPLQLIGQFGNKEAFTETLTVLQKKANEWCEEQKVPLLVPQNPCVEKSGTELVSSLDCSIAFPGDDYENENKMYMHQSDGKLFLIHRMKSGGDILKVLKFDSQKGIQMEYLQHLPMQDIRWIEVMADRYLYTEVYTVRDKYSGKWETTLYDLEKNKPYVVPVGYSFVTFSNSGKYCVLTKLGTPDIDEHALKAARAEQDKMENQEAKKKFKFQVPAAVLMNLETQKMQTLSLNIVGDLANVESLTNVCYAQFSPDDKYVVVTMDKGSHYAWMVESGRFLYSLSDSDKEDMFFGNTSDIVVGMKKASCILEDNLFVVAGAGYEKKKWLFVYDLETGEIKHKLEGHDYDINIVAINDKQTIAATGTMSSGILNGNNKKYVRVWDIRGGQQISVCRSRGPYYCFQFIGKDSEYIAVTSYDNQLQFWHVGTRENPRADALMVYRLMGNSSYTMYIIPVPNLPFLVTGSIDNTLRLWDMDMLLKNCDSKCQKLSILSEEELEKYLNRDKYRTSPPLAGEETNVVTTCMTVSKDGQLCAIGTDQGWFIIFDMNTLEMIKYERVSTKGVQKTLTTRSGKYIVSLGDALDVWDGHTGEKVKSIKTKPLEGHSKGGDQAHSMAEGSEILVIGYGGMECYGEVYDLETEKQLANLEGLYGFSQVVVTSDGKKVATTFFDYPMVFDVKTGQPVSGLSQPDTMMAGCSCLILSPNDGLLVAASMDGSVRVMDMSTLKYKFRFQHRSSVRTCCFTHDSSQLVTAGFSSILVWSMTNGAQLNKMSRHDNFINSLWFTCESKFLVSCSDDKQIIVWDFEEKASVTSFQAHCPVRALAVAEDLSSLIFTPENVGYIGILKPNPCLTRIARGEKEDVSALLRNAQALALAFSPTRPKDKASRACVLL